MRGPNLAEVAADGLLAGRVASERAELWPAGSLAWLIFFGWVTLPATVAPIPTQADLTFIGSGLASSSAWPYNVIAIGVAAVGLVLVAHALASLAEAALQAQLRSGIPERDDGAPWRDAWRIGLARLIAGVPAFATLGVLLAAVAAVVADEFQSPDIGGSLAIRIAGRVLPFLVAFGLALLVVPPIAAAIERRATGQHGLPLAAAVRAGLGDLLRAPLPAGAVTLLTLAVRLVYLAGSLLLLRVLWAPIGVQLAGGGGMDAVAALLLVGFVAIWLCLVIGGGALQAWTSAWWTLSLATVRDAGRADRTSRDPSSEGIHSA
jgi:hypothetical protein